MTTIFKFHYKDHLVRALKIGDRGYILGPDIMPLFGYKKHPLVDINQLLDEGSDKEFVEGVPVISLYGIKFLESYPRTKKEKAKEVADWVAHTLLPTLETRIALPDEVRTEQWDEDAFDRYLFDRHMEETKRNEDKRLHPRKKEVFEFEINGQVVAKAKIDAENCTTAKAFANLLTSAIFKEFDNVPDPVEALKVLSDISYEVMKTIQADFANRLVNY